MADPTGDVVVSGVLTQGETLTADTSALDDPDGLGTFDYVWQRDGVEIAGATTGTYRLSNDDIGTKVNVEVSFVDGQGTSETVSSNLSVNISNDPSNSIGGGPQVIARNADFQIISESGQFILEDTVVDGQEGLGKEIAFTIVQSQPIFNYVFFQITPNGNGAETSDFWELFFSNRVGGEPATQFDLGTFANLRNGADGRETFNLNADTDIEEDEVFTVSIYESVIDSVPLLSGTFTIVDDDRANEVATGVVSVTGSTTEGETLSLDTSQIADADGLGVFTYSWFRNEVLIDAENSDNLLLTQADVDQSITGEVSFLDGRGTEERLTSTATGTVTNTNDNPTGAVAIIGTVSQGEILTADTSGLDDPDGLGSFSYVWLRDGTPISGATSSSYDLTQADVGAAISVEVSYTDGFGAEESVTSDQTSAVANVNDDPTGSVAITGAVTQGETLTVDTSNLGDPDGLGNFSYQWLRDDIPISGSNDNTYVLTQDDVGTAIGVEVSYTDGFGAEETVISDPTGTVTNTNDNPTGAVAIIGTVSQGATLTANTSSLDDPDGLGSFSYVWLRDGTPISGATSSSYDLTQADVGAAISVQVAYTDGYGTAESVLSDPTQAVLSNDQTLEGDDGDNTLSGGDGEDTLSGGPGNDTLEGGPDADRFVIKLGDEQITILDFELGLDLLDLSGFERADALAAFYNAQSGSAILTFGDGTVLTVEGDGVSPATLSLDDVEFAAGNLSPQGPVVITGNTTTGQTLTADASGVSDGDGIKSATVEFQWLRDGVAITDATASTYVLTLEDVGAALSVSYSYTDNFDTAESVTSATTSNVVAAGQEINGTLDPDDLVGGLGSDTIQALAGDDTITGGAGNDQIDGGEGIDTAVYSGDQTSYTLTLSPTETMVMDRRADGNGTDELIDMEFLDFDTNLFGGPVNLGIFSGPTNLSATDLESIVELYIAYFNRAPDAEGLYFWGAVFNNGYTLAQLANGFIDQDETRAAYPESLSNEDFATVVYGNVLGRIPDQVGFDFWVGALDSGGVSRDQFILSVLGGAKVDPPVDATQEFIDQQILDRAYLETKTDIGAYFAVHKGMSDVDNATAAMGFFNGTAPSVISVIDAIDGFYADALDPENGEFLMQLVGVLDDPFV